MVEMAENWSEPSMLVVEGPTILHGHAALQNQTSCYVKYVLRYEVGSKGCGGLMSCVV